MMLHLLPITGPAPFPRTIDGVRSVTVSFGARVVDVVQIGGNEIRIKGPDFDRLDAVQVVEVPGKA